LAVEVKNFAKTTFLSFNITAVFLHDVKVLEKWLPWSGVVQLVYFRG